MTPHDPRRLRPDPNSSRPPTRLRETGEDLQERSAHWAVSMLRQARPYQPNPGRQERVWASLQAVERVYRSGRLRLAFAGTLLFAAGLMMSAAFAQWPGWLARAIHAPTGIRAGSLNRQPVRATERPAAMPPLVPPTVAPASIPGGGASGALDGASHARRAPRAAAPEESELLLSAMRALRVEHSPERARAILTNYLARRPRGALAEEALVMLIEAAVAHGDSDVAALGARYFALYPKGGFAEQVRRALAGPAGGAK